MTGSVDAQRVILVTGGAQGLGAAVARQMAARGLDRSHRGRQ